MVGKVLGPGLWHMPPFHDAAITTGGLRLTPQGTGLSHPHKDYLPLVPGGSREVRSLVNIVKVMSPTPAKREA